MLGWEFPPHISGGLGTACQGLTEGLARRGIDVLFVVPRVHGDEAPQGFRLRGCTDADEAVADDLRGAGDGPGTAEVAHRAVDAALAPYLTAPRYVHHLERLGEHRPPAAEPVGYGPDLFQEVARYTAATRRLARRARFDLVHGHDWMTFPAAAAVAADASVPLVLHVHSCEHDRSGKAPDVRIRRIEQQGLDDADAVVCVSRYAARVLLEHYDVDAAKVHVVHNAVHPRAPDRGRAPARAIDEPVVLFLGRVTFQKGPAWFLLAAARVLREMPRVKFVVAGSGDLLEGMIESAAALGIGRQVHFTGFLRGEALERIFDLADVYVMPSVSEPFGISPLEAAERGVPVVLSRQSGVAEVLPSAPRVDHWDVEGLAAAILDLVRDPARRREQAARAREEVARLRWDVQAEALEHVYEAVRS